MALRIARTSDPKVSAAGPPGRGEMQIATVLVEQMRREAPPSAECRAGCLWKRTRRPIRFEPIEKLFVEVPSENLPAPSWKNLSRAGRRRSPSMTRVWLAEVSIEALASPDARVRWDSDRSGELTRSSMGGDDCLGHSAEYGPRPKIAAALGTVPRAVPAQSRESRRLRLGMVQEARPRLIGRAREDAVAHRGMIVEVRTPPRGGHSGQPGGERLTQHARSPGRRQLRTSSSMPRSSSSCLGALGAGIDVDGATSRSARQQPASASPAARSS